MKRTHSESNSDVVEKKKTKIEKKPQYGMIRDLAQLSSLQRYRLKYLPKCPQVVKKGVNHKFTFGHTCNVDEEIRTLFPAISGLPTVSIDLVPGQHKSSKVPFRVGVVLSGGQAPGGINVLSGMFDFLKESNPGSKLIGFLGGPRGIIEGNWIELSDELFEGYRNMGGFDLIGSGRDKIEKKEDFIKTAKVVDDLGLHGLIIAGGDDSNTNAAHLAQYFADVGSTCSVIGVPKTIDNDLKNEHIEASFGFDSASKVFAELLGNVETDSASARKYWHFVRVMGREASHLPLECALQCHPNICLIGEEIKAKNLGLEEVTHMIADLINERANNGKDFGVVVFGEGIIEFMPRLRKLLAAINSLLAQKVSVEYIRGMLPRDEDNLISLYDYLPADIRRQFLLDRDPHGNVALSKIETEKLLITLVTDILNHRKNDGKYSGKFAAVTHFFGYEGRCVPPSNFDADYCYSLGRVASALVIHREFNGYMAVIKELAKGQSAWKAGGVPLAGMLTLATRSGKVKPVIAKGLVDLNGAPFKEFMKKRESWRLDDIYANPGPIQYEGPDADRMTLLLQHEAQDRGILPTFPSF